MDPGSCLLFTFFLLGAAYCAASETAYTAVSRVRLKSLAEDGNQKAKRALWICDRFDKTLTTILIGNNVFHASCSSLATLLVIRSFSADYVVYGTLITVVIVYLFSEMIPKSIAKSRSEELALGFASSMCFFVQVLTPISFLFSGISGFLSRFFTSDDKDTVTEEDLQSILETIEDEGVLEPEKQALVHSAMEFGHKLAKDIMIPMDHVIKISTSMPHDKLAAYIQTLPYSRLPVYEGSEENIVGILPVNAFLSKYVTGAPLVLRKILLKPYVFDQNTEIQELLQRMRLNKLHMVFICNGTRDKLGIITMEDLLEELVGDIQDESDTGEGLSLS